VGVAERVVDLLEPVEVDEHEGDAAGGRTVERRIGPLPQQRPVGQAGERVVQRLRRLASAWARVARRLRDSTTVSQPTTSRPMPKTTGVSTRSSRWVRSMSPSASSASSQCSRASRVTLTSSVSKYRSTRLSSNCSAAVGSRRAMATSSLTPSAYRSCSAVHPMSTPGPAAPLDAVPTIAAWVAARASS
jgi:hypothetical protein